MTTTKKSLTNNIIGNISLSVFKLLAGIFGHSSAMITDAIHSFSDVFATIIVIIGLKVSEKKADKEHPYGHERFESIAAIILTMLLAITATIIGKDAIETITTKSYMTTPMPGYIAIIAALASIIVKEIMFQKTMITYRKTKLVSIKADAWHHRSDALSSIGALIAIIMARCGVSVADPIASLIIALFIIKVAIDIFVDATNKLTDHACEEETENAIRKTTEEIAGVRQIDKLKTRQFSNKIYIDIEISVDGQLTLNEAHDIAQTVHDTIENKYAEVKHCMVHVNPATTGLD